MTSDKLGNILESYDSTISKSTSFEKCNDLLQLISINDIFNIRNLNQNKYSRISQCRSNKEKDDFKLAQDVSMTIEILNNFKTSKTLDKAPSYIWESGEDINQRFAEIQNKVFSIVFKD